MSTTDVKEAADKLKNVHREMVQWENTLEGIKGSVKNLTNQKEQIQKQIDEKVANANIAMSESRGKIEAERQFVLSEREKLEAGKKTLADQIEAFRVERSAFDKEKESSNRQIAAAKQARANIDTFIVAVQRAYTVLG